MFGYVTPLKSELRPQDFILYRSFYCGICVEIGKQFGSLPRYTTTYDVTFLSVLVHDVMRQEVEFFEGRCIGNPFTKKVMVKQNALLTRLCAANILLSYYKICDDVIDGGGIKGRIAKAAFSKAYKKAKEMLPEVDAIISTRYDELRALEKEKESSIDRVSHSFATLLREVVRSITGKTDENLLALCYNVGKFVYLIDALDDIDEDSKSGNYNPFLVGREFINRKHFFETNHDEISFILSCVVNRATECFNKMDFEQSYTLLKNIIYSGLREKVKELLSSGKKLPRPKI